MERVCRAMQHDATSGRVALAKRCGSTLSQDACGALLSRSNAVLLSRRMPSWIELAMRSSGLVDRCPMDIVRCRRCTGDCRYRSLHCSHARATATTEDGQSYAGPCGGLETAEDLCVVQRHCGLIDTVKNVAVETGVQVGVHTRWGCRAGPSARGGRRDDERQERADPGQADWRLGEMDAKQSLGGGTVGIRGRTSRLMDMTHRAWSLSYRLYSIKPPIFPFFPAARLFESLSPTSSSPTIALLPSSPTTTAAPLRAQIPATSPRFTPRPRICLQTQHQGQ